MDKELSRKRLVHGQVRQEQTRTTPHWEGSDRFNFLKAMGEIRVCPMEMCGRTRTRVWKGHLASKVARRAALSADLAAEGRRDSRNWWSCVLYTAPREAGLCVFLLASRVASGPCYSLAC